MDNILVLIAAAVLLCAVVAFFVAVAQGRPQKGQDTTRVAAFYNPTYATVAGAGKEQDRALRNPTYAELPGFLVNSSSAGYMTVQPSGVHAAQTRTLSNPTYAGLPGLLQPNTSLTAGYTDVCPLEAQEDAQATAGYASVHPEVASPDDSAAAADDGTYAELAAVTSGTMSIASRSNTAFWPDADEEGSAYSTVQSLGLRRSSMIHTQVGPDGLYAFIPGCHKTNAPAETAISARVEQVDASTASTAAPAAATRHLDFADSDDGFADSDDGCDGYFDESDDGFDGNETGTLEC